MKSLHTSIGLFALAAAAEILGCHTFHLWLTGAAIILLPRITTITAN
jgi:drug/metabolite transporter superfamily protein YnfA